MQSFSAGYHAVISMAQWPVANNLNVIIINMAIQWQPGWRANLSGGMAK